jgi:hypothetical protein
VGGAAQNDSQDFVGDIAELLVFDRRLSFDVQQAIVDYLRAKWGL